MKEEKNELTESQTEKVSGGWMDLNDNGSFKTESLFSKNQKRYDRKCDFCGKKIPGRTMDIKGKDTCLDCWIRLSKEGIINGTQLRFKKEDKRV